MANACNDDSPAWTRRWSPAPVQEAPRRLHSLNLRDAHAQVTMREVGWAPWRISPAPRRLGRPIYGAGKSERRISEFVRISRCLLWGGRRIPSRVDPAGEGDDCVCCARSTAGDRQFSWEDAPDAQGPHGREMRGGMWEWRVGPTCRCQVCDARARPSCQRRRRGRNGPAGWWIGPGKLESAQVLSFTFFLYYFLFEFQIWISSLF
jgi:hypothetical protein